MDDLLLLRDMKAVLLLLLDLAWTTGDALPTGLAGAYKTEYESR